MRTNESILEPINNYGFTANVYKSGDQTIKIYKDLGPITNKAARISPKVIEILKNYRNCTFLNINNYELGYDGLVQNYSYDYIREIPDKLYRLEPVYIYYSIKYMDKLAEDMASYGIAIGDNHAGNLLTTPDGLIIIDPDRYTLEHSFKTIRDLKIYNKKQIIGYILNKLEEERTIRRDLAPSKIEKIFTFPIEEDTNLSIEVKTRMKDKKLGAI